MSDSTDKCAAYLNGIRCEREGRHYGAHEHGEGDDYEMWGY